MKSIPWLSYHESSCFSARLDRPARYSSFWSIFLLAVANSISWRNGASSLRAFPRFWRVLPWIQRFSGFCSSPVFNGGPAPTVTGGMEILAVRDFCRTFWCPYVTISPWSFTLVLVHFMVNLVRATFGGFFSIYVERALIGSLMDISEITLLLLAQLSGL